MARRILGALALVAFTTVSGQELIRNRTAEGFNNTPGIEVVCISDYPPFVHCEGVESFTGYSVELFRHVADILGERYWENRPWEFRCMDWDDMIQQVKLPQNESSCTLATGGINVLSDYLDDGIQFSQPTFHGYLGIMIYAEQTSGNWSFLRVFSWEVWTALLLTTIGVGMLVAFLDIVSLRLLEKRQMVDKAAKMAWFGIYSALGRPAEVPASLAGRIVTLFYAFLCVIMLSLYTSNTAAALTTKVLDTTITGLTDLPRHRVITWEKYRPKLTKYGIYATGLPWTTREHFDQMLDMLREGEADALVLDMPYLDYMVSSSATLSDHCKLSVVGKGFESTNIGMAFSPDVPDSEINQFSAALVELQEKDATLDRLKDKYTGSSSTARPECSLTKGRGTLEVQFEQVFGLWLLLFAAGGAALLFVACQEAVHHVMQGKTGNDEEQCSSEVGRISVAEKGGRETKL